MISPARGRLDESGFETILEAAAARGGPSGIDLSAVSFADPYGIVGLLCIGLSADFRLGQAWGINLPEKRSVRAFLERSGAMRQLARQFVAAGRGEDDVPDGGDTLLGVTAVKDPADVHRIVSRVKARTDRLLVEGLGYNFLAADRFTVAVAEICQNIVDHSGSTGFAAAQLYAPKTGRKFLKLAVGDAGVGMRKSLAPRFAGGHPRRWDDREALHMAFRRGVSRFEDPGRGLGLKLVAEMVRGWQGRFLVRSGTAAYAIDRSWSGRPRRRGLAYFPGVQINFYLPSALV